MAELLSARLKGPVSKEITVETNDPDHASFVLVLNANVVPIIDIEPTEYVYFTGIKKGSTDSRTLTIKGGGKRRLTIRNLRSTLDFVKAVVEPDPNRKGEYKLTVTVTPDAPPGNHVNGQITFDTNFPEMRTVEIHVMVRVE